MVALQEVDNRSVYINDDYLSELAESTGMHSQFFALVGTYYGIGILSKTEPISVKTQSFAIGYPKTRSPAVFSLPNLTTSISFVRIILLMPMTDAATDGLSALHGKVIGLWRDFNAQPTYRAMVTFKEYGFSILNNTALYTYPAKDPTVRA